MKMKKRMKKKMKKKKKKTKKMILEKNSKEKKL